MATSDQLINPRFYTALDPYYYTVDNRPLTDLHANDLSLAQGVDAAKNSALVDGVTIGLLTSGVLGNDPILISDLTLPGGLDFNLSQGFFAVKESISEVDSRQITKLALLIDQYDGSVTAPGTAGNSIDHLVQVRYVDVDTGTDNLPLYDPFNPHAPGSILTGVIEISIKSGAEASTGSQVTPAADAGWTGVFVVTVADTTVNLTTDDITFLAISAVGSAAGGGEVAPATETAAGIIEIATNAEVQGLSATDRAVVPSALSTLTSTATRTGLIALASQTEAEAGSNNTKAMTALRVTQAMDSRNASVSQYGTIQLADNSETQTGTDSEKAVTPAGLSFTLSNFDFTSQIGPALTNAQGIIELATNAEALTGTDGSRAITPAGLKHVLDNTQITVDDASTVTKGIVELATTTEVLNKTDALRAVTPAALGSALGLTGFLPQASASTPGIVALANNSTTSAGTNSGVAVTPAGLASAYVKKSGGTFTGSITAVNVTATGTVQGNIVRATSASKYKENVSTLENALDICSKLRGVNYTWKKSGEEDIGFIAEEVGEVLPSLVYKENGEVEALDYLHLGAVFANAINELNEERKADKSRIEDLEAAVNILGTRIEALEGLLNI